MQDSRNLENAQAAAAAPLKIKRQGKGIPVILLQAAIAAMLIGMVLLCRTVMPDLYKSAAEWYQVYFEQDDLAPQLVRFANAALDSLSVPSFAAQAVPFDASTKSYVPEQSYVQPVTGYSVSSEYGWRKHPITKKKTFHKGVDLSCAEGTPVVAAMDGIVDYTLYSDEGGISVRLRHANGVETAYCHMQYAFVRAGEEVYAGQVIGTAGATGNATGPHLHFSLLYNDIYYDPSEMLGL
jgi:murein DD-endopeptidase MepM/ murein hydrolase activator NlpD